MDLVTVAAALAIPLIMFHIRDVASAAERFMFLMGYLLIPWKRSGPHPSSVRDSLIGLGRKSTYRILALGLALSFVVSACDHITIETTTTTEAPQEAITTSAAIPVDTSRPTPVIVD